ncbi:MAG: substrate-binding domain-containing protein [bacterium]
MRKFNKKIIKQGEKLLKDLNNWKNAMASLSQGDFSTKLQVQTDPLKVAAAQAKEPDVIFFNQLVKNLQDVAGEFNTVTDIPCKRLCYVGADSFLEGSRCGELMGEYTGGKGEILIVIASAKHVGSELRRKGFVSTIQQMYPNLQIVEVIESKEDKEICYNQVLKLLKNHPNLKGLYISEGNTPCGAARALIESKKEDKVIMVSHDLTEDTMQYVTSGVINATLGQDPYAQGHDPVIHLYNYLVSDWEPQVPRLLTHMDVITPDNYTEFWDKEKGIIQSQAAKKRLANPVVDKPENPIRISVLGQFHASFWVPVKKGVEMARETLKDRQVQVDWIVPEDNIKKKSRSISAVVYNPVLRSLIEQKVDGIAVVATDRGLIPTINDAVAAGIPVITLNSEPYSLRSLIYTITNQAERLMNMSHQLANSTTETKTMTSNINTAMDEMYQGTVSQNENVKKTQNTLTHLLKNIKTVNEETDENAKAAEQTVKAVTSGTTAMEKTIESLRTVEKSVTDSWQVVEELGDYSNKIDRIMWFINDIATEINILGLNANLVSVKAGKYGESFGVVAREIRKMVQETKNHTSEIFDLIEQFKEGVKKVEEVMNTGLEMIKGSAKLSDEAVSSIKDIRKFVNINQQRMGKISSSLNKIEKFSHDVNVAMHSVTSVSEQNAAEVQKVNNYTKEMENQFNLVESMAKVLLTMAESEKQLLAKFNVSGKDL